MTVTAVRPTLERTAPFEFARADDGANGDGLTLSGYAAVYDTPTLIDSWEGTFHEQIKRGAFSKTIRESTPVLQFDHGRHPLIGSIPIGSIKSLKEDDHGLAVSARMSSNWLTEPIREAIAEQSIKGMSFRFEVIKDEWRDVHGKLITNLEELQKLLWDAGDRGPLQRTLKEVRLHELGPVVWPAYSETEVSLRSRQVVDALANPAVRAEVAKLMFVTRDDITPVADTEDLDIEPVREDHSNGQDSEVSDVRDVTPEAVEQMQVQHANTDEPAPGDHSSMTRNKHLRKALISRVFSRVESSGMRYRNDSGRYRAR